MQFPLILNPPSQTLSECRVMTNNLAMHSKKSQTAKLIKYGIRHHLDSISYCNRQKGDKCTNDSIITPPRVFDRELILRNYRQINSKVRTKFEQDKQSRRFLFTFDPAKIRIKSPIVRWKNSLLKESGFRKVKKTKPLS